MHSQQYLRLMIVSKNKNGFGGDKFMIRKSDIIRNAYFIKYNEKTKKAETVMGLDKAVDSIKEIINETLLYADEVSDENEKLKADLKRGFPITEEQYAKIEAWKKEHTKKKHPDIPKKIIPSFLTSNFVYRFYRTHFDHTLGAVYCDECFEKMREELGYISNYDSYNEYYDWLKKLNNEYDAIMNF